MSPDGRYLAYNQMGDMSAGRRRGRRQGWRDGGNGGEMEAMGTGHRHLDPAPAGQRPNAPAIQGVDTFDEASPKFSPDGKWVAYCSNQSGQSEVYVEPWPGPGMGIQISSEGGTDPLLSRDGRRDLLSQRRQDDGGAGRPTAGEFEAGMPRLLWEGHYSHGMSSSCGPPGVSSSNYDVTADGQRFLMIKDDDRRRRLDEHRRGAELGGGDEASDADAEAVAAHPRAGRWRRWRSRTPSCCTRH